MIVVNIELWPWGCKERKRNLATIAIANTAGNVHVSDYDYAVSHQEGSAFDAGSFAADPESMLRDKSLAWKSGRLEGFARKRGAVQLVKAVLGKAFAK